MPVYNGQAFIGQAVDSILNQTYSNFELIIINDHSTDDTCRIIDTYQKNDNRIIGIKNSQNWGISVSLNRGIEVAKGCYIGRMDADDISLPTRFEKQIDFLERHDTIGLLGTNGTYIDEAGKGLGLFCHFEDDLLIRWGSLFNSQFIHGSIMFRHSLIPQAGTYREDFKYAQDYEYFNRLLLYTKGANLKERLVEWRKIKGNISSQRKDEQLEFGVRIAMDNINRLFGYSFVSDQEEMLVFRGLYRGSFQNAREEQVSKFLQILEKFKQAQAISPAVEKRLKSIIATRMFEALYRKGIRYDNYQYLGKLIQLSPLAVPAGLNNLSWRAVKKALSLNRPNLDNQ